MFTLRRHCRKIHRIYVASRTYSRDSSQEFSCRAVSLDAGMSHEISSDDEDVLKSPWASEQDTPVVPDNVGNACLRPTDPPVQRDESGREVQQSRDVKASPTASVYVPKRQSQADDPSKYLFGELPLSQYVSIIAAVKELLEQHDAYNIPALCQFVKEKYTMIPPYAVPYIVHAACEGAKYASQMYLVQRAYVSSGRPNHLTSAKNAVISLTAWSVGPRPNQHSLSSSCSSTATPTPTYKPTPKTQLVMEKIRYRRHDTSTSDDPTSEEDSNIHRPSSSNVEMAQNQPRVLISEKERSQADRSLNEDNHVVMPGEAEPIEGLQAQKPENRESTIAIAGPSTQSEGVLPEIGTDIVSAALMMTGIVALINTDDGTLEDLLGQQSSAFEEDHVLNVEPRQPCNPGPAVSPSPQNIEGENNSIPSSAEGRQTNPDAVKGNEKKRTRGDLERCATPSHEDGEACSPNLQADLGIVEVKKRRKEKGDDCVKSQSKQENSEKEAPKKYDDNKRSQPEHNISKKESAEKEDSAKKRRKEERNKKVATKKEDNSKNPPKEETKQKAAPRKEDSAKNQLNEEKNNEETMKKDDSTINQSKQDQKKEEDSNHPQKSITLKSARKDSEEKQTSNEEKQSKNDTARSQSEYQRDKKEAGARQSGQFSRNWQPRFDPRQNYHGQGADRYRGGNSWSRGFRGGVRREKSEDSRRSRERSDSPIYVPKAMMDDFKRFMQDKNHK